MKCILNWHLEITKLYLGEENLIITYITFMGTYQTNADGIEICQLLVLWEWQVAIEAPSEASSQLLEDIYLLQMKNSFQQQ